jgi:predicted regulator of Ras-like GTPase activity (Roadblock/LC7/MglB family)
LPYRRIIEALLERVPGARTALLLDAQGEVVVGAGDLGEQQRLIGAYEGIALGIAGRIAGRFDLGPVRSLIWRHAGGAVVLATLKDGYHVVLSLGPSVLVADAARHAEDARLRLEELLESDPDARNALELAVAAGYYMSPRVREAIGYPGQRAVAVELEHEPAFIREGLLDHVPRSG